MPRSELSVVELQHRDMVSLLFFCVRLSFITGHLQVQIRHFYACKNYAVQVAAEDRFVSEVPGLGN